MSGRELWRQTYAQPSGNWKKPLQCPLCAESRASTKGIYYRLKIDHDLSHEEAFELAGDADYVEVWPK